MLGTTDPVATAIVTHTEFRIETMQPTDDTWRFRHFVGASNRDLPTLRDRLSKAIAESAEGWRYRIASRTVSTMTSPWVTS